MFQVYFESIKNLVIKYTSSILWTCFWNAYTREKEKVGIYKHLKFWNFSLSFSLHNFTHSIIHGRFPPLKFFCPPHSDISPNIILRKNCPTKSNADLRKNCERAFVWEITYPLESSNSSGGWGGGGNILVKIKWPTGQNLEIMT